MKQTSSMPLLATALATLGLATAAPSVAGVVSQAVYINGTIDTSTIGGFESRTADASTSILTTEIGFASATVNSAPGAMAGQATVSMDATEFGGAMLEARAQGRTTELLHFGTDYCVGTVCQSAARLGVTALNIHFAIHASGGASAFASDPRFDHSTASVSYGYALTNGVGFTVSGGGMKERHEIGEVIGDITSASGDLAVRPGDTLELLLNMMVFASANINGWHNSGFTSAHVLADADFAHTLLWDGITDFTAFGANGQVINLAPGGRFQLIGDSGNDFWNASPGFGNPPASVPEPTSLSMLLMGLALGVWKHRQRPAKVANQG